ELIAGLEARGAEVARVSVYRWGLLEDVRPLRAAVTRIAKGECNVALFTSATQVDHVMQIATELRLDTALRTAARGIVVASIGPVGAEALRRHGLPIDIDPPHPRMGHLVATVAQHSRTLLAAKREQVAH